MSPRSAALSGSPDPDGEFFLRHLRISVVLYAVAGVGTVVYVETDRARPPRHAVTLVALVAVAFAVAVVNPLRGRIIASPHRLGLLYSWSALTFACVALLAYLDGGARSPLMLLLLLALQYVAMAYRPRVVAAFSVAAVGVVCLIAIVRSTGSSPAETELVALLTGMCGLLGTGAAHNRERQQIAQQRLAVELEILANCDPLTGCLNRRRFDQVLRDHHTYAIERDESIALLLLDVDGFKQINDAHGHPVGDDALRSLVNAINADTGEHNSVARLGGDEFAVILPATELADARHQMASIRAAISRIDTPLRLEASIGLAVAPARETTIEQLICSADARLYEAKALRHREMVERGEALRSNTLR